MKNDIDFNKIKQYWTVLAKYDSIKTAVHGAYNIHNRRVYYLLWVVSFDYGTQVILDGLSMEEFINIVSMLDFLYE